MINMITESIKVLLFAGGKLEKSYLSGINAKDFIIAADNAALWLINHKITPDVAIGDFDSVTYEELEMIKKNSKKCLIFPSQKDQTDLELAVDYAINLKPKGVIIYGAIGSRMDHTLVAINLLLKFLHHNIPAKLIDKNSEIFLLKEEIEVTRSKKYKYLSIIPLTEEINISLSGFKYNLKKKKILKTQSRGISNEIVEGRVRIVIHKGIGTVIRSKD